MNEVTLLIGKQASGKSSRAKEITKGKKVLCALPYQINELPHFFGKNLDENTEYIIIEEVTDISEIMNFISQKEIKVDEIRIVGSQKNRIRMQFKMPKIIVCLNS